jgi:hypothetical protein
MAHSDEQPMRATVLRFGSLDFAFDVLVESPAGVVFSRFQPEASASPQGQPPEEPRSAKSVADQVWNLVGHDMAVALGPNPSQELFRFAAYEPSCFDWLAGGGDAILGRVQTLLRLRVP